MSAEGAFETIEPFCLTCFCEWRSTTQHLDMIDECIYHAGYFRYAEMTELKKLGFREDSFSQYHGQCFSFFYDSQPAVRNKRLSQM